MADTELRFIIRADTREGRAEVDQLINRMRGLGERAEKSSKQTTTAFKLTAESARAIKQAVSIGAGALVAFSAVSVKAAVDAEETASKFATVFGTAAGEMDAWITDLKRTVPETSTNLRSMAASLQDLLVPIGIIPEKATEMNKSFISLAADLASFNNIPMEEALAAIRSGLVGSSEPLQKFGVDARVAALETIALEAGLIQAGEEMTQTVRAEALLIQATKQSAFAMGDAARTMGSTANQLKFLKRDTEELSESWGKALIPALAGTLQIMTGFTKEAKDGMSPVMLLLSKVAAAPAKAFMFWQSIIQSLIGSFISFRLAALETQKAVLKFTGVWDKFPSLANTIQRDIDSMNLKALQTKENVEKWEIEQLKLNAALLDLENQSDAIINGIVGIGNAADDAAKATKTFVPVAEDAMKLMPKWSEGIKGVDNELKDLLDALHPATRATIEHSTSLDEHNDLLLLEAKLIDISTMAMGPHREALLASIVASNDMAKSAKENAEAQEKVDEAIKRAGETAAKEAERADQAWSTAMGNLFSGTVEALTNAIFEAKNFGEAMAGVFRETGKNLLKILIAELFSPLNDLMAAFAKGLSSLLSGKGFSLGGGGGGGGGLGLGGLGGGLLGGLGLIGGGVGIGGSVGGTSGAIIGGGLGLAGAGSLGLLGGLGAFGAFAGPIGAAIAAVTGIIVGLKALFTNSPQEAGVKEAARDFGVKISENMIAGFRKDVGLSEAAFEPMRKAIMSSPRFLENFLIPAARAQGVLENLISRFGSFQTAWGTFDLSEPLREAIQSGNFEAYNAAWARVFANSGPLAAAFGDYNTALAGTSIALEDVTKGTIEASVSNDQWMRRTVITVKALSDAEVQMRNYAKAIGFAASEFSEFQSLHERGAGNITGVLERQRELAAILGGEYKELSRGRLAHDEINILLLKRYGDELARLFGEVKSFGFNVDPAIREAVFLGIRLGMIDPSLAGFNFKSEANPTGFAIPKLQHGGIVSRPTLAMIGEGGPEAVVPLNQMGGVHVDMRGAVIYGMDDFEDHVLAAVSRGVRRGGLSQVIQTK